MAALSAASNARMANSRGGTNSGPFIGGIPPGMQHGVSHDPHMSGSGTHAMPGPHSSSFLDTNMSAPNSAAPRPNLQIQQRYQGFLVGLANIMAKRNTPLPPQITGVPTPQYDHHTSAFKSIELSPEVGHFRLGGRDIDVFKLWGTIASSGGGRMCNWQNLASQFGLPEELPLPHGTTGNTSSVRALQACYDLMLGPFEELYKRNIAEQQKKAQLSSKQPMVQPPGTPNRPAANSISAALPSQMPRGPGMHPGPSSSTSNTPFPPGSTPLSASHNQSSENVLEDMQGFKRKHESEDADQKRVRQKTEPRDENSMLAGKTSDAAPTKRLQPVRRKIEYVPLAREVDTYGGRDLKVIESEMTPIVGRDPSLKEMNEWGSIETDALIMSIRSRISTELSYALTTLAILSTMKGQQPGSGFPINQCGDLFEDLLDLIEELAFEEVEDKFEINTSRIEIPTQRQLVNAIVDEESTLFGLQRRQGDADPGFGLRQRPGNTILMVLTIIRNLALVPDNNKFIVDQYRLVDLLLRLCIVSTKDNKLAPFAPALSLSDLITVRKDTLTILGCMAGTITFSNPSSPSLGTMKTATRILQLVASYLIDPAEAISPSSYMQLMGSPNHAPPALADLALDVFTRLGQSDTNRQVFSKTIPPATIMVLVTSLVRRLPVLDVDFQLIGRETWLSYMEKVVMSIYSVAFLAPPTLKTKIKTDRSLGMKGVYLRMIQKFLIHHSPEVRSWYILTARRAVETLKVLDDGEDSFDTSKAVAPTMAFGMGWGDANDADVEQGTGLLAGHRGLAWELLMQRDVLNDDVLFNELESLTRVECPS
ncbi:hypothetical protein BDZ89DRAFT_1089791 [Hymenopellis radicata]|nr:hypothetical protein BDZ89DRAFT_1089791 [Hymenopellis radicata]